MVIPNTPVCKFFQTSSCRFGNKCKFRHVYEDEFSSGDRTWNFEHSRNKPSGVSILQRSRGEESAPPSRTASNALLQNQPRNVSGISDLTNEIADIFKANENSGIWPLSCFSLNSSYGNVPGFEDISPEELRLKAYTAKNAGNFEQYISEVQSLIQNVKMLKDIFLKRGQQADLILSEYIKQASNIGFSQSSSSTHSNFQSPPFSFNVKPESSDMECQSPFATNIFGQVPQKTEQTFGTLNSINFGQVPQANIFSTVPEVAIQESAKTSVFGPSATSQSDIFKNNLFGSVGFMESPAPTVFGGLSESRSSSGPTKNIYSDIHSLSAEDVEQFKGTTFTYGKVPLKPPPLELCH